jgi:hypothetical protein
MLPRADCADLRASIEVGRGAGRRRPTQWPCQRPRPGAPTARRGCESLWGHTFKIHADRQTVARRRPLRRGRGREAHSADERLTGLDGVVLGSSCSRTRRACVDCNPS